MRKRLGGCGAAHVRLPTVRRGCLRGAVRETLSASLAEVGYGKSAKGGYNSALRRAGMRDRGNSAKVAEHTATFVEIANRSYQAVPLPPRVATLQESLRLAAFGDSAACLTTRMRLRRAIFALRRRWKRDLSPLRADIAGTSIAESRFRDIELKVPRKATRLATVKQFGGCILMGGRDTFDGERVLHVATPRQSGSQ
jgi:hypothetical protein